MILIFTAAVLLQAPYGESPYLFGLHDPGGENHMADKGHKGWILFTEAIGHNAADPTGRDYRPWADQGYGVIVRLNNDYGSGGGIPYQKHYDAFAQRAANFVGASPGAHLWIIANEMNWQVEWPAYEGFEEPTTPTLYAQCYLKVRAKIKSLGGHATDQVMPGPSGTYGLFQNSQDWVSYYVEVLNRIGQGNVDAVVIHTYTHGSNPGFVSDESKFLDPRVSNLHWNFRAYRDYLAAIPAWSRTLPVYITETDQNDPWADVNSGWVQAVYREINDWNLAAGTQKIRAVCLYRWQNKDPWVIEGKWGVINDFRDACGNDYRWPVSGGTPPPPPPPPPPTGQPDVIVTSLSYSNGLFTCTVKNQGTGPTPAGVVIGVGYYVDNVQRGWGTVPGPLAAGASVSVETGSGTFTIGNGTHTIMAYADDVNRFNESNEGNNQLSQSITIGALPPPSQPDVIVTSLTYSNGVFGSVVKNQGGAATPAGVTVGVAYWVDGAYRTWGAVAGPLAAGSSATVGTNGGSFVISAGTHTIMAVADDVNRFLEANESNNSLTQSVTVGSGSPGGGGEAFESIPAWSSTNDASWGTAAAWAVLGGGAAGNYLACGRNTAGSSEKVLVFSVPSNATIEVAVYMRCAATGLSYWMESACRPGNWSAADFDANGGSWTMIKKFDSSGGQNGNGDAWTRYSLQVATGSATQLSVGFKLGSTNGGGPTVGWDQLQWATSGSVALLDTMATGSDAPTSTGGRACGLMGAELLLLVVVRRRHLKC